mgnify:CR=1 FL=1
MNNKIAIVILTYNCERILRKTILAAKKIHQNIIILDSYSSDKTLKIAKELQCIVFKRKFINYSKQRNYIIRKCNKKYQWQLHLDADEVLSEKLIKNIKDVLFKNKKNTAYLIKREIFFLKQKLKFGGTSNYHLRFFPSNTSKCEDRLYDQHFVTKLKTCKIDGVLNDMNINNLSEWISAHNKWSSLAAKERLKKRKNFVKENLFGNSIERVRFIKQKINYLPLGIKGFILFLIKYIILFGFLDGKKGFIYCFLNSFWFHTLIDAKKLELKKIKVDKF